MMQVKLTCNQCHSIFKIGVVEPTPVKSTYNFCPYCGSTVVWTDQFGTEEYSFEVLAESLNIPVSALKLFYNTWIKTPNSPKTLKEFMIQQLEQANAN